MEQKIISYIAAKTARALHNSRKFIRGFMGPVGNGKTVACINELVRLAEDQWPNNEGVRKSRWVITRNTEPELLNTTLKTFKQWVPSEICRIVENPTPRGTMRYPLPDGTTVEAEFIFLALDRPQDVKKVLSLEITGAFMNEAREQPYVVLKALRERSGRYPAAVDGYTDKGDYKAPRVDGKIEPCKRKAILMDTNPMADDHWWYQLAEEGKLRDEELFDGADRVSDLFEFFRGPPPLLLKGNEYVPNPLAENIEHLPGGYKYYLDMIPGNTREHINVMVLGNYGTITDGRLVYTAYNDGVHCAKEPLKIDTSLSVGLGWDFGLTPAVAFTQLSAEGQLRVVAELVSKGMDVRRFARDVVKPFFVRNFKDIEVAFSFGDPSGTARGDGEGKSAIGILNDEYIENVDGDTLQALDMPFETVPAPTNEPVRRVDAVSSFMLKLTGKGQPGYLLSPTCKVLREGKLGKYCLERLAVKGEARYRDKPTKNEWSHVADAEQYAALGWVGYVANEEESAPSQRRRRRGAMGY